MRLAYMCLWASVSFRNTAPAPHSHVKTLAKLTLLTGICAGKHTVAEYLVDHHGFKSLYLNPGGILSSSSVSKSNGQTEDPANEDVLDGDYTHETNADCADSQLIKRANGSNKVREHTFDRAEDLVDFVTTRWRERWVTTDVYTESILDVLLRRPFFILVSVDAPASIRWKRFNARSSKSSHMSLEAFLETSDEHLYSPITGLLPLISRATVRLLNTCSDLAHLYATLGKLDLTNEDRLRPSWDQYFMQLASLAAQRSNCMKRRVGCVLVREKRVISTGYNGTPRGLKNCGEGGCPRCNGGQGAGVGLSTCLCIHAEENALLEAGRERIREGAILYCDTCPCLTCSIKITQVGISEVVYSQGYSMDGETAAVFKEAGVHLRQFSPVSNMSCLSRCSVLLTRAACQWLDTFGEAGLLNDYISWLC